MTRGEKMQAQHSAISALHTKIAKIHRGRGEHELADHHDGVAAGHGELAKHCGATSTKADTGNLEKRDSDLRETVAKMVREIIGDTVRPTEISRITPNAPGYVMVPRNGSPMTPTKPNVDASFTKLFSIEDVDETSLLSQ